MDDTIRKQSLELSEMKQMLERLVQNDNDDQNREDMISSDQEYVEEHHTEEQHTKQQHTEHQEETQREHQQESGSDISIDDRDADLLMTIKDVSNNLNAKSQKEKDLLKMIITLPIVSQPLALCEMSLLDQTVQIHEVPPSISIVNEESQLTGINKPNCIVWQHIFNTHLVTPNNKKAEWIDTTAHLNIWVEKDLEYYFNTAVGDFKEKPGWGDVNYVIACINIKEHWLAIAADMRKCKIYVFDSIPNYVEQKLVDQALQMPARCIASLAITIGVNHHSERFT
ncbi:Ulp1-like peptidase [Cucumis melo var. makuwa]|uniref:Ulp1-like peptidase n=1 Tax=Cucumis melo var. makuwa TaxID=1194695 RepID=A0A5D3C2Z8_CUCMM|nr:Ulp1-like peptidase [Cucumis melo var. makuwa]